MAARSRVTAPPLEQEQDPAWSPTALPAVAALLDHLAEELAREYVQLMERAASVARAPGEET